MGKIHVVATINAYDLAEMLDDESAINVIIEIDKYQANVDFTMDAIKALIEGLKKEYTDDMDGFKEIIKEIMDS